jgi:hypothetical protein
MRKKNEEMNERTDGRGHGGADMLLSITEAVYNRVWERRSVHFAFGIR